MIPNPKCEKLTFEDRVKRWSLGGLELELRELTSRFENETFESMLPIWQHRLNVVKAEIGFRKLIPPKQLNRMKDHWTHYLPEGKRIFRDEVEKIHSIDEHIKKVKEELSLLEKEKNVKEYQLGVLAIEKGYSGNEIDIALMECEQKRLSVN